MRLTYSEAVKLLEDSGAKFEFPVAWGNDLQAEHERYLTEQEFKRPVILYDYPRTIKPFYMRVNDDGRTVAAILVATVRVADHRGFGAILDWIKTRSIKTFAVGITHPPVPKRLRPVRSKRARFRPNAGYKFRIPITSRAYV